MLEKIVVDNYLLIDHIEFEAQESLSVFIGETGSGKSLFIEALGIILGNKFSYNHIGEFREQTMLSAIFQLTDEHTDVHQWLSDNGFLATEELIITRIFQKSGKSTTRLNGEILPVQTIKGLADLLIDIHSQFDTQQLLKQSVQQVCIDERILKSTRNAYRQSFEAFKDAQKAYTEFKASQDKSSDLEYLYFQREELFAYADYDNAKIEAIESEYKQLRSVVQNQEDIQRTVQLLGEAGIRQYLPEINRGLQKINDAKSSELFIQMTNLLDELDYEVSKMESDESVLEKFAGFEQTLQTLYRLQQKHGDDLQQAYAEILERIEQVEKADEYEIALQKIIETTEADARQKAQQLDDERKSVIEKIENEIILLFTQLHLTNLAFKVSLLPTEKLQINGLSNVQFEVASNNQAQFQPLAKVVSGGELSRIMLALKVVLLGQRPMLMIFDEIDSGVSGKVASSIADVLSTLATQHQLFLITHSPLVAVSGQHFYHIQKMIRTDQKYETIIQKVKPAEINYTLAQLISQHEPEQTAIEQIAHLRKKYE